MTAARATALVHLASGIGNIVLATPLLVALERLGIVTDVLLDADYRQTADLLRDWSAIRRLYQDVTVRLDEYTHVVPAIPPFYWQRFARRYAGAARVLARPPDSLFWENEQEYYLDFARRLGYGAQPPPFYRLPIVATSRDEPAPGPVVMAPGCKTGEMAVKRWPYFVELASEFADVLVVGTPDDVQDAGGQALAFPAHVTSLLGALSLRETVEVMAGAAVLVGNDSGLSHAGAATGVPTIMLFGPTPHATLGRLPPNVTVMRRGLACEPCWMEARLRACQGRRDCLARLPVAQVADQIRYLLGSGHTVAHDASTTVPLVSCIMPTRNRRAFVPQAIAQFLRQDYPARELIVLDDGSDGVGDLMPDDPRVRYIAHEGSHSVGAKRNAACEAARGALIAHWDDDDWMADSRLSYQVRALIDNPTVDVCGLDRVLFYDRATGHGWEYVYPAGSQAWVAGGTMCYRKSFWQRHRFPETNDGEDTRFLWANRRAVVLPLPDRDFYVAMIHPANTSPKRVTGPRWRVYSAAKIAALFQGGPYVGTNAPTNLPTVHGATSAAGRFIRAT